jgi:hypothetical protein
MNSVSKNAENAKRGFRVERLFCESTHIRTCLETYFAKPIDTIHLIKNRKKSDIQIVFVDESIILLQNKDGTGNGRGWSMDRRSIEKMPIDDIGKQLIENVCLKKDPFRPDVPQTPTFLYELLTGSDESMKPTHLTHTILDTSGQLKEFRICAVETFLRRMQEVAYPSLLPKKTCVHLNPYFYLQRKGGSKGEHAPNHIQLKCKKFPTEIMSDIYVPQENHEQMGSTNALTTSTTILLPK